MTINERLDKVMDMLISHAQAIGEIKESVERLKKQSIEEAFLLSARVARLEIEAVGCIAQTVPVKKKAGSGS